MSYNGDFFGIRGCTVELLQTLTKLQTLNNQCNPQSSLKIITQFKESEPSCQANSLNKAKSEMVC